MMAIRSTPLRLTGTLIVVFVMFTLAGYATAYLVTRSSLNRELTAQLNQTVGAIQSVVEQDEIRERIEEIAAAANSRKLLLRYTEPGEAALGNLPSPVELQPNDIVRHTRLALQDKSLADSYLGWEGPVGGGQLTLLVGRDSLDELGETFAKVLLFSLIPALLLATTIGALVARKARNRMEAIRFTLTQLTSGHQDARVSISGDAEDDLGQIGIAINRMADAQEASIEALRQVSADIAHDLRTPIQRVSVLLHQLDDESLSESAQNVITQARDETAQIVTTFQALLQIAQLESGQARSTFTDVNLSELVLNLTDVFGPASEESGHQLTARTNGAVIVEGNPTLLGRLIANLIENALRHTPPGRILVQIDGEFDPVLTVSDEGPGIPEEERDRVLHRLYRLERSRTSEGSGLGLSLVAAIAELHNATLTLGDAKPGLSITVAFGK
ncbi:MULTISPECIES: HAMP domain-containing sensor histidine kinase [Halomonadaceae]|uniref:histidine kinase n=1 Tax=Onishia taeanensis TaxID=284577 RepID=A0A328XVC0_9GAMM|nr:MULTISPECIES: HAMP domain-containing sensor histidine kinase [Halomonas]RAR62063.1 signal transduction histidine kinase [Halomonas taeanensis]